jgi:centromere protein C
MQYFANTQRPSTPRRNGSSSRPVTRTSDIDFDQVPSPRQHGSQRKSASGPGPSNLSKSLHARDLRQDQDSDPPDNDAHDHGGMDDNGAFEDYGQPDDGSPPQDSPQHQTSFTQMDQDDDEDEGEDGQGGHDEERQQEEDRQTPLPPLRRNKGKERAVLPDVPEEDEDVEDEIAQGLQHYDDDGGGEEEDRTEPEKRQNKKAKLTNEEARKPGRSRGKSKKENRSKSLLLRSTPYYPY